MINAYEQMIVLGDKADGLEGVTTIGTDGQVNNSEYQTAREQHERFRDIVF